MTRGNAHMPMWPGVLAQLEAVKMTPLQRERAKRNLQRAERLVDIIFAAAAGLKRLLVVAILEPGQSLRRRRGARRPLNPADELGHRDLRTSQDVR